MFARLSWPHLAFQFMLNFLIVSYYYRMSLKATEKYNFLLLSVKSSPILSCLVKIIFQSVNPSIILFFYLDEPRPCPCKRRVIISFNILGFKQYSFVPSFELWWSLFAAHAEHSIQWQTDRQTDREIKIFFSILGCNDYDKFWRYYSVKKGMLYLMLFCGKFLLDSPSCSEVDLALIDVSVVCSWTKYSPRVRLSCRTASWSHRNANL